MAKITNQSGLTSNNLLLHTVELNQRTTVSTNASSATAGTISDSANQFVSAGFLVGDRIRITYANPDDTRNGFATITSVAAGSIGISSHTGTFTTGAAGPAVSIQRVKKTFQFVQADGLDFVDGVAGIALTSELQTLWDTGGYDKYDFPYDEGRPLAETIEFVDGWEPHDTNTINAIRDSAILIRYAESGQIRREYMNVTSDPLHGLTDQPYYWQADGGSIVNTVTQGYVNQLILIYDADASIDRRGYFRIKTAEPGKTVILVDLLTSQSISQLTAKPYRISLPNALDLKLATAAGVVLVSDNTIETTAPYTSITLTKHDPDVSRSIEGISYNFDKIVERTGATAQQVHTKLNWMIRQNADIDSGAGTLIGKYLEAQSYYVGEEIFYRNIFTDGLPEPEKNISRFIDATGTTRQFDTIAAFTLTFTFPAGATQLEYAVYQEAIYNTAGADFMEDSLSADMTGIVTNVGGVGSVSHSVRFSTFNANGHTPNTPIPIRVTWNSPGQIIPDSARFTIRSNTTQIFPVTPKATTAFVA